MTQDAPSKSKRGSRTTIVVVSGLLVAFTLNVVTSSPIGWPIGALAAVLAWLLTRPRA